MATYTLQVSGVTTAFKCHSNICRLATVNKRLAVRYVPFLLTKVCFCPLIWTKSWSLLSLIDVQCCVYAREAALESAVLLGCHVLIYKRFQACCLVLAHKDRHFMELIKWSVADMRYINFYFGVIKQSIFGFFSACPCFLLFFSVKIWQHWHFTARLTSAASPELS